jgi:hypothetical protein
MKIWHLDADYRGNYAEGGEYPSPYSRNVPDPDCHDLISRRDVPLQMFWNPGSDVIPDFVNVPSAWCVVATGRMREALAPFGDLRASPVEFVEHPDHRLPKRRPRVRLPYQGPPLFELRPTTLVHFDPQATSVEVTPQPCGHPLLRFSGFERWETRRGDVPGTVSRVHIPREPGRGLIVRERELRGTGMFGLMETQGSLLLCTDAVRDFVLREGFTNVSFAEMGETISG